MAIPTVGATVTTDTTNSGGENAPWDTISHTTDAGTDLLIALVNIGFSAVVDPTIVRWDGTNLTLLDEIVDSTNTRTQIWYLKSPLIKAATGRVTTWGGGSARIGLTFINISGSDPTDTFGTSITAVNNNNAPQLTVVSAEGELVVSVLTVRDNASVLTVGSGIIEHSNFEHLDSIGGEYATGTKAGAAATLMDWSNNQIFPWTMIGVAIKPVTVITTTRQAKTTVKNVAVSRASLF